MGTIHNDRRLQSGRSWENGDQSESIVHVTRMLTLWPSESDYACDADLSLLTMRSGHPPRPQRRKTNRTKGTGSPCGEWAKCRMRRTENQPGDRPGIPCHNAIAFGGGRMSREEPAGTSHSFSPYPHGLQNLGPSQNSQTGNCGVT